MPNHYDLLAPTQANTYTPTSNDVRNAVPGPLAGLLGLPGDMNEIARSAVGLLRNQPVTGPMFGLLATPRESTQIGTTDDFGAAMGANPDSAVFQAATLFDPSGPIGKAGKGLGLLAGSVPAVVRRGADEISALGEGLVRNAENPQILNRSDFIYNPEIPAEPPNSRRIIDAGIDLQEDALRVWGGKPMGLTPENAEVVAKNMTDEALAAYRVRPEMAGWYKENLGAAMEHAAKIHPELATDPQANTAFKFIMAITSNGQEVPLNAKLTDQYYRLWRETGQFPVLGSGKEADAMRKSFGRANDMVKGMGWEGFERFLNTDFTVKELQALGLKAGGENVDTVVKGSALFGPKIGGGFMQNLFGNFDPPTFDRWWQRTWGRHSGTLVEDPAKIGGQITDFVHELEDVPAEAFKALGITKKQALAEPEEAARVIFENFSKKNPERGTKAFEIKSPVNNAARNLVKSLDNVVDAPAGGAQRNYMRGVITQVRDNMRAQGIPIDTADVQALLWFAEKDLYGKLGARVNTETVDYATVWRAIAEQAGAQ